MQNQDNFFKKEVNRAKMKGSEFFSSIHRSLKEKGGEVTIARARNIAMASAVFLFSFLATGVETAFETYPLGVAVICGVGQYYLAAFLGAVAGALRGELGREYIFAFAATFLIRAFVYMPFMPRTFLQRSTRRADEVSGKSAGEIDGGRSGIFHRCVSFLYGAFGISEEKNKVGFFDTVGIRLVISAFGGFVFGLFLLISNDFSLYSFVSLLFLTALCPLVTAIISGFADKNVGRATLWGTLSTFAVMLISVYAARNVIFASLMLAPLLAMLFTLICCRFRGISAGILMAICSALMFDVRCIPILVLSAVAYAMLGGIKRALALAVVVGICLAWSYYFFDISSFVTLLPPMLVALPVFLIVEKAQTAREGVKSDKWEENKYFAKSVSEESKNQALSAKVSSLSDAFSSLSRAVCSLSDKFLRPDTLNLKTITDRGFDIACDGCPNRDVCFGAEYDRTVDAAGKITSALHKKGYVDAEDLPGSFSSICVRKRRLVEQMNLLCAERTESVLKCQSLGLFASSYDDIKDILRDAIDTGADEYECDTVAGGRIYDYLKSVGYEAAGVVVCGKRCKRVMLRGVSIKGGAHDESAMALCRGISDILGVKMVGPVFEVGDDGVLMLFSAKPKLSAICSSARMAAFESEASFVSETTEVDPFDESVSARREELCGDVTCAFLTDTSYFYSLISDGMGSGRDAAISAGICSMFCEKMLMAGNRADITIRMLNNFLRAENSQRGVECSVTVDIFELDLMLGVASFIKSGAAPTYILRGGEVYKVASKTMPVGIIKNPDIKITKFDMRSGDVVLMMSDGISGECDDDAWIIEQLCEMRIPDVLKISPADGEALIRSLMDKILSGAKEGMQRAKRFDDASLSVVLVV